MFEGAEIGISDIHGRPIRCGDRLRVRHVNYMGQQKEYVAQEFIARVMYHPFTASFRYYLDGPVIKADKKVLDPELDEPYFFNHRSSTFEIITPSPESSAPAPPRP